MMVFPVRQLKRSAGGNRCLICLTRGGLSNLLVAWLSSVVASLHATLRHGPMQKLRCLAHRPPRRELHGGRMRTICATLSSSTGAARSPIWWLTVCSEARFGHAVLIDVERSCCKFMKLNFVPSCSRLKQPRTGMKKDAVGICISLRPGFSRLQNEAQRFCTKFLQGYISRKVEEVQEAASFRDPRRSFVTTSTPTGLDPSPRTGLSS
ncbi:unnamed protein product [Prorocentrum cordatum]|uniref:Uncharacterized protein n=1 Tax=Prorocentrum cordatum TaxID=2364126 RepID=A0ABN9WJV9_9DINO|nr:unnamed protein product [Polarella glacialis]